MAIRFIEPEQQVKSPSVEQKPPSTGIGTIERNVLRTGARLGESIIGNLAQALEPTQNKIARASQQIAQRITGAPRQETGINPQNIRSLVTEPALGKEISTPKNYLEEVADLTAETLPVDLLLGGPLWSTVGRSISRNLASKGAEKAGGGPVSQILAGALGSYGFNKLHNFYSQGGSPRTLAEIADKTKNESYAKERELGQKIKVPAKDYEHDLLSLQDKIKRDKSLNNIKQKELETIIEKSLSDLKGDKVLASDLIEAKQQLNSRWPEFSGRENQKSREYLERIQAAMFKKADQIGQSHPEWYKAWKTGDDIIKAQNYKFYVQRMQDKNPNTFSNIIKSPLAGLSLGFVKGIPGAIGGTAVGYGVRGIKRGAEYFYGFYKFPGARQALKDTLNYAIEDNAPLFFKSAKRLNKLAEEYEKKEDKKEKVSGITFIYPQ
jgi:hypothetical protein